MMLARERDVLGVGVETVGTDARDSHRGAAEDRSRQR
jgi:hypothetical protein